MAAQWGGAADETIPAETLRPLPADGVVPCRQRQATRLRLVSVFRQGWIAIMCKNWVLTQQILADEFLAPLSFSWDRSVLKAVQKYSLFTLVRVDGAHEQSDKAQRGKADFIRHV